MGGDHSISSALVKLAQDGLGNGSSGCRLGTRTELVNEHECLLISHGQHVLHVSEERTVCTEVVVDGLVISYVHHDPVEHKHLGCFRSRDQHSPLEHVLEKAHCLQTDGLSSCIRS